jgi:hypothetical protein
MLFMQTENEEHGEQEVIQDFFDTSYYDAKKNSSQNVFATV